MPKAELSQDDSIGANIRKAKLTRRSRPFVTTALVGAAVLLAGLGMWALIFRMTLFHVSSLRIGEVSYWTGIILPEGTELRAGSLERGQETRVFARLRVKRSEIVAFLTRNDLHAERVPSGRGIAVNRFPAAPPRPRWWDPDSVERFLIVDDELTPGTRRTVLVDLSGHDVLDVYLAWTSYGGKPSGASLLDPVSEVSGEDPGLT